jgi:hypothetical protein
MIGEIMSTDIWLRLGFVDVGGPNKKRVDSNALLRYQLTFVFSLSFPSGRQVLVPTPPFSIYIYMILLPELIPNPQSMYQVTSGDKSSGENTSRKSFSMSNTRFRLVFLIGCPHRDTSMHHKARSLPRLDFNSRDFPFPLYREYRSF